MNAPFGIDHPLIAVNDIIATRERFITMGFNMTPLGKHPWGTNNTLAMFNSCLIEIVGVYDHSLIDKNPAGDFHFGRHVYEYLKIREGIALSALHSTKIEHDTKHAIRSGFQLSGTVEFGREVILPDGTSDRTKTSLSLLPDDTFPRLSFFLCQQHKPELIYVPEWLSHPNTVYGYEGITIRAEEELQSALRQRLHSIYDKVTSTNKGFYVITANGTITVQTQAAIEERYCTLPVAVSAEREPAIVAMDFRCADIRVLQKFLEASELKFNVLGNSITITDAQYTGNTILRFFS